MQLALARPSSLQGYNLNMKAPPDVQKIPVPLSLEPAAVKKYATEMEALKRKVRA